MTDHDEHEPKTLGREVRDEVVREAGVWLKWALGGALLGALLLGGLGLFLLGLEALMVGAALGAVLGGVGAWLFYLNATTF